MMQELLRRAAYGAPAARRGTVLCARWLIYLLYGGALLTIWRRRRTLPLAHIARAGMLVGGAPALGKLLSRRIDAPRPFVTNGVPPLFPADPDEGFPSTHAIQATALTAAVWDLGRGGVPPMAAGAILVMLARLGANVHHTRDMLGGVGVSIILAQAIRRLPLPPAWEQPLPAASNRADNPGVAMGLLRRAAHRPAQAGGVIPDERSRSAAGAHPAPPARHRGG